MISVVYVSSGTKLFSDQELLDILQTSRKNNERLGISGMLLYKDGAFMQVLEGDEDLVLGLYETIAADPRHKSVMRLLKEQRTERQFPEWSMGFRDLRTVNPEEVPGYSKFLQEPLTSVSFQQDPTRAQKLLLSFKRNM